MMTRGGNGAGDELPGTEAAASRDARAFPVELEVEYEVVRELGRGGMGVVYLARDRELRRDVAIKVVQAQYVANAEVVQRFAREARTVAGLDHPNIVRLYSVRKLADDSLALVMQYVPGETLQQALERDGAFAFARARQVLTDIAHALGYAHARGIVHRDVKPENVFLDTRTGRALLSDFGIARSGDLDPRVTRTNVAIGTPAYMSPEQIDGSHIDGRSDLYSLGLVGWEIVAGRQPWHGEGLYSVIYRQKNEELPPLSAIRRETPVELVAAVQGALEKDPDIRWSHSDDFLDVLTGRVPAAVRSTHRDSRPAAPRDTASPPGDAAAPTLEWHRDPAGTPPDLVPPPTASNTASDAARRPSPRASTAAALASLAPPEHKQRKPSRRRSAIAAVVVAIVALGVTATTWKGDRERRTAADRVSLSRDSAATLAIRVRPDSAAGSLSPLPPLAAAATAQPDSMSALAITPPRVVPANADSASQAAVPGTSDTAAAPAAAPLPTGANDSVATTALDTSSRVPAVPIPAVPPPSSSVRTDGAPASVADSSARADVALVSSSAARATLAPGGSHSCEIAADSTALCWGANSRGQLGDGTAERRASPTPANTGERFVSISAGLNHSCAVSATGAAYCWGGNDLGQLGDGTLASRSTPVRVLGLSQLRTVESANVHSCALSSAGQAYCWGANPYGELGVSGGQLARPMPVLVPGDVRFTMLALGWNHTCGLTTARRAVCWGQDSNGQLGTGAPAERRGPVAVTGDLDFVSIAAGSAHSCAVATTGSAYCWGRNDFGQLGDGTTVERAAPSRVRADVHFVRITAGSVHSCALTSDGDAYCWGRNVYGQLGNGAQTDRSTPVRVQSREPFLALRASGSHTCATTASRQNVCWGYNINGQLGDGTRSHRSRPVAVTPGG